MKLTLKERLSVTGEILQGIFSRKQAIPFSKKLNTEYFVNIDPKYFLNKPLSPEEKVFIDDLKKSFDDLPYIKSPNLQIADIGSGLMMLEKILPINPTSKIWCIDINPRFIEELKKQERSVNTKYLNHDVETEQYAYHSFEFVFALNLLHYLSDVKGFLRRVDHSLKNNGFFVVSVCYLNHVWHNDLSGAALRFYKRSELVKLFHDAGFMVHGSRVAELPFFPFGKTKIGETFVLRKTKDV